MALKKKASLFNKRNSTNANAQKLLKKLKKELSHTKNSNLNTFKAKSINLEIQLKIDNHEYHVIQ